MRVERKNSLVNAKSDMAEEESFEVRKQLFLTSYFEISSTERAEKLPSELATHICFASYGLYCTRELLAHLGLGLHT